MNIIEKRNIRDKFWNDLKNDFKAYKYEKPENVEHLNYFYNGYANGLYEAGVLDFKEHEEVMRRLTDAFVCEKARKNFLGPYALKSIDEHR
jgi:hypothetical protein